MAPASPEHRSLMFRISFGKRVFALMLSSSLCASPRTTYFLLLSTMWVGFCGRREFAGWLHGHGA
eukprot:11222485-Lingulodinium_polyedra.AAC.1